MLSGAFLQNSNVMAEAFQFSKIFKEQRGGSCRLLISKVFKEIYLNYSLTKTSIFEYERL